MSDLQIVLDQLFHNLLYNLPPLFPFWIIVSQCLVLHLEQGVIQKQFFKLLQLVIHVGGLKNFIKHLVKCLQFTFQFLNLYLKLMGTIFHVNVHLCQLFPLL